MKSISMVRLISQLAFVALALGAARAQEVSMPTAMCSNYQPDPNNGGNYCTSVLVPPDLEYIVYWDNGDGGAPVRMKHVIKNTAMGHDGYFAVFTRTDGHGLLLQMAWSMYDNPDAWWLQAWASQRAGTIDAMCQFADPECSRYVAGTVCDLGVADQNMRTASDSYQKAAQTNERLAIAFHYEVYRLYETAYRACKLIGYRNGNTNERENVTP
jgi:hypothetical protein